MIPYETSSLLKHCLLTLRFIRMYLRIKTFVKKTADIFVPGGVVRIRIQKLKIAFGFLRIFACKMWRYFCFDVFLIFCSFLLCSAHQFERFFNVSENAVCVYI